MKSEHYFNTSYMNELDSFLYLIKNDKLETAYSHNCNAATRNGRPFLELDCSLLVDFLLAKSNPAALQDVYLSVNRKYNGMYAINRLYTCDFYEYFSKTSHYFDRVKLKKIAKGDIITYLPKQGAAYKFGHMGIVADENIGFGGDFALVNFLHSPRPGMSVRTQKLRLFDDGRIQYGDLVKFNRRIVVSRLLPQFLIPCNVRG
ncbi:MAG: hypothetical protein LBB08_00245 [Rickettsiales bacterium]|jgi:hypothetical protein|nr:hypothetical protein [Rickettsiales bacterium]